MNTKITIVTVTFNCEKTIEETIKSVCSQNYSNIEYIVVDGNSTDRTIQIISNYKKYITTLISEPDYGIFDAMNKGVDVSSGQWIIFMNSGDRFASPTTISDVFNREIPQSTGFIFGKTMNKKAKLIPFVYSKKKYTGMGICHQSIFVRSDLAKKIKFDLKYKYAADYNMIRKIYSMGYSYIDVDLPICYFDKTGLTSQHRLEQIIECGSICNAKNSLSYWKSYFRALFQIILRK